MKHAPLEPHPARHDTRWRRRIPGAAAVLWAGVIFALSSVPGSAIPGRFGSLAHFAEYAVLAALLAAALLDTHGRPGAFIAAIALASAYATTDELHQAFVVLRTPDHIDWLIDTAGATVGAGLTLVALELRERRRTASRVTRQ